MVLKEEGSSNSIRNRSYILREISLYRTEQEEKGDQALQAYYDIKNRQRKSQFSIEMNHGFGAGKDSAERIQVPDLSEAHNTTAAERRLAMLLHLKNRGNVSTRLYAGDPSSPIEQAFRSQQREMRRYSVRSQPSTNARLISLKATFFSRLCLTLLVFFFFF